MNIVTEGCGILDEITEQSESLLSSAELTRLKFFICVALSNELKFQFSCFFLCYKSDFC